jgi:ribosomal protein S18 acetylase RimI-like enzyme
MPGLVVAPLPAGRIGDAVAVLRDAFRDDPIFTFHFPDATLRTTVLEIFFGEVIRAHMRFAHVYAAMDGDRLIGTAVWRPPDAGADTWRDRLRAFISRRRLAALAPDVARKLLLGFATLEKTHPAIPHWYLFFIGLDPASRGRSIGAALMAPVLKAADAANTFCYLETPFPQAIAFYRKLGYEVSGEPRPFPGAPQLWAMTRRPGSAI